jgi:hypothetical protein
MRGAGGTSGGISRFLVGLVMMVGGGYLFLSSITVTNQFHMGYRLFHWGGVNVTSGMVLIPFVFGIGFLFYNAKNIIGWLLTLGSLVMLGFGVLSTIQFRLRGMSGFELITILALLIGGVGVFLSSLRNLESSS